MLLVHVTLGLDEIPIAIGELDHVECVSVTMGAPHRNRATL